MAVVWLGAMAQVSLTKKKKRVLLKIKNWHVNNKSFKSLLNGVIEQDTDLKTETSEDFEVMKDVETKE